MKSKEQEQEERNAFQDRWKDASRDAVLQRLYRAQHQAILYVHQIDAYKKRATWLEEQLASARRLIDLIVQGEISEYHAQIFLHQVLGEQTFQGEPDASAQESAHE